MSKPSSLAGTMLVTFVIAIGIGSAWQAAANWLLSLADDAGRQGSISESISLGHDGEPLIVRSSYTGSYRYTTDEVLTLEGQPKAVNPAELYGAYSFLGGADRYIPEYPASWWERLAAVNDNGVPETYWYLVHDGRLPGRAYGVGFHSKTKLLVGHFSRKGFSQAPPPQEDWFELPASRLREVTTANINSQEPRWTNYDPYYVLLASGKLWLIDLPRREVKALADCPRAYTVGKFAKVVEQPAEETEQNAMRMAGARNESPIAARGDDHLTLVDQRTGKQSTIPLPVRLRDATMSGWLLPDGKLVVYAWWSEFPVKRHPQLLWLDAEGTVTKEHTLRLTDNAVREFPLPEVWRENLRGPVPLEKTLLWLYWSYVEGQRAKPPSLITGWNTVFKRAWLAALVLFVVCIFPAWAAYRRQKRFGLPHAAAWAAFVYILGIPGWIAYRFHRAWPILEECPSCRQTAPHDRDHCTECGAAFPPPPLKGIEVFA